LIAVAFQRAEQLGNVVVVQTNLGASIRRKRRDCCGDPALLGWRKIFRYYRVEKCRGLVVGTLWWLWFDHRWFGCKRGHLVSVIDSDPPIW